MDKTNRTAAKISALLLAAIAETGSTKAGFDRVLGAGAYEALAGNLYDALRAKTA